MAKFSNEMNKRIEGCFSWRDASFFFKKHSLLNQSCSVKTVFYLEFEWSSGEWMPTKGF